MAAPGGGTELSRRKARNSLIDDLLLPYPPFSKHGSSRSHREARDCLRVTHGNTTHETWPSNNNTTQPVASTRTYVSVFPDKMSKKIVYGHFTFINNPLRTVSVLEPGGLGGCDKNFTATVAETVKYGKCLVAQNGGFFNTSSFQCLGNVVSNGRLVQSSKGIQNAQFGIRKDGTMVFGYLSEEEVLDTENPFVQLVSGVIWLVRNGEVYVNQSRKVECDETQTGNFDDFVNKISARTAVGHDTKGRLVLFHADGQTDSRGLNLWEMAEFLKNHDVYNAINLDGGGSATLVLNGTLSSYPSDHCSDDSMWRCERSISTVVCVHEPYCDPQDCGGHGLCVAGECHCSGHWTGSSCDVLSCGPSNCSAHGMCTQSGCQCDAGWMGSNCSDVCIQGYYGDGCASKCHCQNNGTCDHIAGTCTCTAGFKGPFCEEVCPLGFYGVRCRELCQCEKQCYCHHATGTCSVARDSIVKGLLTKVGHCMESVMHASWWDVVHSNAKIIYLTEQSWAAVCGTLAVLLVISAAFNIKQVWPCRESHKDRTYSYQQLRKINGNVEVPDMYDAMYSSDDMETPHSEGGRFSTLRRLENESKSKIIEAKHRLHR
ncbi:N-acetylglucosamine-1-phosphodiester alpha-N-acetylglucosaminidase [Gastrophryne carolinensis]